MEELLVALGIAWTPCPDLFHHGGLISHVIETVAIAPDQTVHRCDFDEADVILQASVRQFEQICERVWSGDDGRPGVEGEAVIVVNVGPSSRKIPRFVEDRLNASALEPDGRTKASKAAADHRRLAVA